MLLDDQCQINFIISKRQRSLIKLKCAKYGISISDVARIAMYEFLGRRLPVSLSAKKQIIGGSDGESKKPQARSSN